MMKMMLMMKMKMIKFTKPEPAFGAFLPACFYIEFAYNISMQPPLPREIKRAVFQKYLDAEPMEDIARACQVAVGSVSNIVKDYTRNLDPEDVESLSYYLHQAKQTGFQFPQCVSGFRLKMQLQYIGIDTDDATFYDFIRTLDESFIKGGESPAQIGALLLQFAKIKRDANGTDITIMPQILQQQMDQKNKMDTTLALLGAEVEKKLAEHQATMDEVRQFGEWRKMLSAIGLSINEPQKLARVFSNAGAEDFDLARIVARMAEEDSFSKRTSILVGILNDLERKANQEQITYESQVKRNNQELERSQKQLELVNYRLAASTANLAKLHAKNPVQYSMRLAWLLRKYVAGIIDVLDMAEIWNGYVSSKPAKVLPFDVPRVESKESQDLMLALFALDNALENENIDTEIDNLISALDSVANKIDLQAIKMPNEGVQNVQNLITLINKTKDCAREFRSLVTGILV